VTKAEFCWSERSAQNFMSVAEKFKSAIIADLPIQPSAAYLLAAPSVPDEAREKAVKKAEAGEGITFATAREIVAEARKRKRPRRQKTIPAEKLAGRLVMVLERYRDRGTPRNWRRRPANIGSSRIRSTPSGAARGRGRSSREKRRSGR
jgi:hypothetical protein